MKPRDSNPKDHAIAWALSFCADWEECREDPYYAAESAWALLAAWGALTRFFTELPPDVASVPIVAHRDAAALLAALRQAPEPNEWLERSRDLNGAWDFTVREDWLRELEMGAIDQFDRLDRHSLALCMARRLDSGSEAAELARRGGQLAQAEEFFVQHVDAFLPAAPLARAEIAAFRSDLEMGDPELWLTTGKHRRLKEVWEEAEAISEPGCLTERDKQAIFAKVGKLAAMGVQSRLGGIVATALMPEAKPDSQQPMRETVVLRRVNSAAEKEPDFRLAASPQQPATETVLLVSVDGWQIECDPSSRPGHTQLQLGGARLADHVDAVNINDTPVALVEPFDKDGIALARTVDLQPVLDGTGSLKLILVKASTEERN